MTDKRPPEPPVTEREESSGIGSRFPELAEIQREIELRIRDNKRFLERFMDEDFAEEGEEAESEGDNEDFEEL